MRDDDKSLSQLVSRSLSKAVSLDESQRLERQMKTVDGPTKQFAELSQLIQDSVSHAAQAAATDQAVEDTANGMGLTEEAKGKLRDSVAEACLEQQKLSQAGLIAPSCAAVGSTPGVTQPFHEPTTEEGGERTVVSRFQLLRKLGEGGLGRVWLARDERLNRKVAIKELKRESFESPQAWQRFQREAEITGRLEHPNIVPLYQYGDDQQTGEQFYAMRFVGKRTLADAIVEFHDRLAAGQEDCGLGLHRLLAIYLDVCQAIAYAHSRGVVHRDIKPENIALDNFGQVVVLDWGLAKFLEGGDLLEQMDAEARTNEEAYGRTMIGDAVGTPLYMSPEQALGKHDQVNQQTDVYGLGAVLYAILTGKAPHADTAAEYAGKSLTKVLAAIAENDTPTICKRSGGVPCDLESIYLKAMEKKQHLRFASVEELAEQIERWMAGQSEQQTKYEQLRMEGRELRADLQSFVRDAERNVRFMSHLPPIQELAAAESADSNSTWRERLATIFRGLLEANPDYNTVLYSQITDDTMSELVRVERHSKEQTSIRSVPRSRLRSVPTSSFVQRLASEKPEEVVVSLVCDPTCEGGERSDEVVGLVAGIPIYDDRTEEPFGIVMIGCDIDRVLERQLRGGRLQAAEIVVACDTFHTMAQLKDGRMEDHARRPVVETAPHFELAVEALQNADEYIDETNSEVYGARIWFIPKKHGLMYLLRRKTNA